MKDPAIPVLARFASMDMGSSAQDRWVTGTWTFITFSHSRSGAVTASRGGKKCQQPLQNHPAPSGRDINVTQKTYS